MLQWFNMNNTIFREIVDNTFEGVIIINSERRIAYMNRVAGEITGFSQQEAVNKYCYEILRVKRCKDACPLEQLKNGIPVDEIIVDIITRDNSEKYIKAKVVQFQGFCAEIFHDITREVELEKRIKAKYIFQDIITQDDGLIEILDQFPGIAASNVPVLFEGESGVGKEVFCSALQSLSERKDQPFVKLNCAALPETLLESELFGYKKGAFTDARKDKPGLFILADKGTIFLDEIGEMSLSLQAKLLRVVETGEVIPLGSTRPEKVDVRILAATNKNLALEIRRGNFREDLYYRLNVVNIRIPSLRERKNDILLFIYHFIYQFNVIQKKSITGISDEAMEILMNHNYPGNIRELRNIMEYAFIFCKDGDIQTRNLPKYLFVPESVLPILSHNQIERETGKNIVYGEGEKGKIISILSETGWNIKQTAAILGINRTTLWRRLKKYGIKK